MENRGRKLNYKEACAMIGCKKTYFYWLIMTGALPAYRVGARRGVWVYEEDCRNLLKKLSLPTQPS